MAGNRLARGNLPLDGVEEGNELLVAMALHVAANHRAIEHIECSEQRLSLVVVRSSVAGLVGCDRVPESGSFRWETGRWHELAS